MRVYLLTLWLIVRWFVVGVVLCCINIPFLPISIFVESTCPGKGAFMSEWIVTFGKYVWRKIGEQHQEAEKILNSSKGDKETLLRGVGE